MYEAYDRYVKNALYDAMVGYATTLTGQFKKTGSVTAENLNALCDLVSTATGYPVMIMGTKSALSKVTALQNAQFISDAMKNEHYRRIVGTENIVVKSSMKTYKWINKNTHLLTNQLAIVIGATGSIGKEIVDY